MLRVGTEDRPSPARRPFDRRARPLRCGGHRRRAFFHRTEGRWASGPRSRTPAGPIKGLEYFPIARNSGGRAVVAHSRPKIQVPTSSSTSRQTRPASSVSHRRSATGAGCSPRGRRRPAAVRYLQGHHRRKLTYPSGRFVLPDLPAQVQKVVLFFFQQGHTPPCAVRPMHRRCRLPRRLRVPIERARSSPATIAGRAWGNPAITHILRCRQIEGCSGPFQPVASRHADRCQVLARPGRVPAGVSRLFPWLGGPRAKHKGMPTPNPLVGLPLG